MLKKQSPAIKQLPENPSGLVSGGGQPLPRLHSWSQRSEVRSSPSLAGFHARSSGSIFYEVTGEDFVNMQPHTHADRLRRALAALSPHGRGPSRQSKPRQGSQACRVSSRLSCREQMWTPAGLCEDRDDLGLWAAGPGVLDFPAAVDGCLPAPDTLGNLFEKLAQRVPWGKRPWPLTPSCSVVCGSHSVECAQ